MESLLSWRVLDDERTVQRAVYEKLLLGGGRGQEERWISKEILCRGSVRVERHEGGGESQRGT
jgi:hypothetical protein